MISALSIVLGCIAIPFIAVAIGRLAGAAICVLSPDHPPKEITCRFCGEKDYVIVSDDDGTACMPCLRFQEALRELEAMQSVVPDEKEMP